MVIVHSFLFYLLFIILIRVTSFVSKFADLNCRIERKKLNKTITFLTAFQMFFFRLFRCECELPSEFVISFTFKINQPQLVEIYLSLLLDGNPNYLILGPPRIGNDIAEFIIIA